MLPVIIGGGQGLFGRNKGCISSCREESKASSLGGGLLLYEDVGREVGREKFIGLEGGDDFSCPGDELHTAVSEVAACGGELDIGDCGSGRICPSSTVDSGRLPGIVAKPPRATGGDEWMAARISWCTDDVSQLSKALSTDIRSPAGYGTTSNEDRLEYLTNLVFDDPGPTLVDDDLLVDDSPLETGVLGGELRVIS